MEKKTSISAGRSTVQNDMWLARALAAGARGPRAPAPASSLPQVHPSPHSRMSVRRRIDCTLLVNFGSTYVIASDIFDFSLTGAYVNLDAAGAQLGDMVEVVVSFSYQGDIMERRIPAIVARLQSKGVGLKFEHYDDQTYTDLVNLLYAA